MIYYEWRKNQCKQVFIGNRKILLSGLGEKVERRIYNMIDKSNYTKVGEALYLKFTSEKFQKISGKSFGIGIYEIEESSVPIYIVESTQGDYECVCEFGTEIHEFN